MITNAIADIKVHAMTTVMDVGADIMDVIIHVIGNVKHVLDLNVLKAIVLTVESAIKESKFILHKNMSSDIFFYFLLR